MHRLGLTLLWIALIVPPGTVRAEIPGPVETRSARSADLDLRAVAGVAVALDDHRLFFGHVHDRVHLPHLQVELAFLHRVCVELDYSLLRVDFDREPTGWEPIEDGYGSGDLRVRTRFTVVREKGWVPAMGVQLGVKLPNAGAREGFGTDETDMDVGLLVTKGIGPVDLHGSMALGILGNPMERAAQDDVFLGSFLAVVHAAGWLRLLAEVAGMPPSPVNSGRAVFRGGVGFRGGGIDVGVVAGVGMTPSSPRFVAGLDVGFHGPLRRDPEGD